MSGWGLGAWFLMAFGALALPAAGDEPKAKEKPADKDQAVFDKLDRKVPLSFKDTPLVDALKVIKAETGILISVDPEGLNRARVRVDTAVRFESREGEPLKDSLRRMLRTMRLVYFVMDGLLQVTSDRVQLIDREPQTKAILAQLERRVDLKVDKAPLEDVLKAVRSATKAQDLPNGIPIYVDPVGLQETEKTMLSPVTIVNGVVPLEEALRTALQPLGLVYTVKDGLLTVTSAEAEDVPLEPQVRAKEDGKPK
jgi:hypothetical protein